MTIARRVAEPSSGDVWAKLAAPLPADVIQWRQDGKPILRDGKHFARFVAYVDAQFVRERLDTVIPGEWDLHLEVLPPAPNEDGESECCFKARLQILGVTREDVGMGKDYKAASSDAFKRVAVRFGIAHELYAYEQNWVEVDGDGRYARPVQDPGTVYAAKQARKQKGEVNAELQAQADDELARRRAAARAHDPSGTTTADAPSAESQPSRAADEPLCPKCGGRMWDNRLTKRNPKAPDYKCRSRSCDGVIWPPREGQPGFQPAKSATEKGLGELERERAANAPIPDSELPPPIEEEDDLPF